MHYDRLMKTIVGSDTIGEKNVLRQIPNREDVSSILNAHSGTLAKPQPLLKRSDNGTGLESIFSREDRTFGLVMGKYSNSADVAEEVVD